MTYESETAALATIKQDYNNGKLTRLETGPALVRWLAATNDPLAWWLTLPNDIKNEIAQQLQTQDPIYLRAEATEQAEQEYLAQLRALSAALDGSL